MELSCHRSTYSAAKYDSNDDQSAMICARNGGQRRDTAIQQSFCVLRLTFSKLRSLERTADGRGMNQTISSSTCETCRELNDERS